jgi:hypothetical protein
MRVKLVHLGERAREELARLCSAKKACRKDISVLYYRVPMLFADLAVAHGDARYRRLLRSIARAKLLILDDWEPEALNPDQARDLLDIVEDRYEEVNLRTGPLRRTTHEKNLPRTKRSPIRPSVRPIPPTHRISDLLISSES